MKMVALIARILLGLVFFVFGLNGFLHFIPAPPPPGVAGVFAGILISTHYFYVVSGLQVVGGALLLLGRYLALALTLLGPIVVNIFLFHWLMEPKGLPLAIVVVMLWGVLFWAHKRAFAGVLASGG